MKKTLVLLLAVIMAFTCLSTFASAEKSPEGNNIITSATAKDKDNNDVKIIISPLAQKVDFSAALTQLQTDKSDKDLKIIDSREITVVGTPVYPITITFKVPSVTSASKGYFLHKKADNTIERIDAIMGDGTMTGTFNSLSPVAIVVDIKTANTISASTAGSDTTSPKTSADKYTPIALTMIVACAFVAVLSVKKIAAYNK